MVHPYLRRRQGIEPVVYPSDAVESVLERTLGVPIFQEQVMQLAVVAAGFHAGRSRPAAPRPMAAWKRKGGLEPFEQRLIDGMRRNGYDDNLRSARSTSRSSASASTAFPNRTRRASRSWSTCRRGSNATSRRHSPARC